MRRKLTGGVNVGTSSILVTFVLLCLVTFAALSFLSANSDYKLSKQTAKRTTDYYAANRMAEYYMADIEAQLAKCKSRNSDYKSYTEELPALFEDNDLIFVTDSSEEASVDPEMLKDTVLLSYDVPVNDTQDLHVCLSICDPYTSKVSTSDALFHIVSWQTLNRSTGSDEGTVTLEDDGIGFMMFD